MKPALLAVIFLSLLQIAFAALTDSQAITQANMRWPGKAVIATVRKSGTTSLTRWVGHDNGFGGIAIRGQSVGSTWDAAFADADSKVVTSLPAPSRPLAYGPFLVETDPAFSPTDVTKFVLDSTIGMEYGTREEVKHRVKTALYEIRRIDPAKVDAILGQCHCTLESW